MQHDRKAQKKPLKTVKKYQFHIRAGRERPPLAERVRRSRKQRGGPSRRLRGPLKLSRYCGHDHYGDHDQYPDHGHNLDLRRFLD